jgi:large subunit ribosomal protein L21
MNEKASRMYAVIRTGGKQYKVSAGDRIRVEQLPAAIGTEVTIDQVLAVGGGPAPELGAPLVGGASVLATVLAHGRGAKVRIFKLRRRKHYQKHQGHRQNFTELFIGQIASAGGNESADAAAALERARRRREAYDRAVAGGKAGRNEGQKPAAATTAPAEPTGSTTAVAAGAEPAAAAEKTTET